MRNQMLVVQVHLSVAVWGNVWEIVEIASPNVREIESDSLFIIMVLYSHINLCSTAKFSNYRV